VSRSRLPHTSPLPPGQSVEVTTQFDTADDERFELLAAGQRPYDDSSGRIGQRSQAGAASLPNRLVTYLDRAFPMPLLSPGTRAAAPAAVVAAGTTGAALTLVEACQRLAVEEPALYACVVLCCLKGRPERVVAAALGIANGLVNRRKWAGVAALVVWSHRSEGEVVAWLDGLRRLWTAREAGAAAAVATVAADDRAGAARTGG